MNTAKKIGKYYGYGVLYSGALTMGYTYRDNKLLPFKEKVWNIADDMSKCVFWPVTAPGAIKSFLINGKD